MRKEINPLEMTKGLVGKFVSYLFSATPIDDDELDLQKEFLKQMEEYQCYKGPYIRYQPTYERSVHFSELFSGDKGLSIDPRLKSCFKEEDLKNPQFRLYTHQDESLRKSKQGHNILVATGTGSGKTECFLLPILDDAVKYGRPGVRSIIVYPMNALANDQLERLSKMLAHFENSEVTFGRYTGETPQDEKDANEKYPDYHPSSNERFTREQIQDDPPNILLTNFAMLEYLLIRPKDASIFKPACLKYVVLDEAHTYRGAQGIEVALLMRRLKFALDIDDIQYFLTSATIASEGSTDVRHDLADFAKKLTGSRFLQENILFGQLKSPFPEKTQDVRNFEGLLFEAMREETALEEWLSVLSDSKGLLAKLKKWHLVDNGAAEENSDASRVLFEMLSCNPLMKSVYDRSSARAISLEELSNAVWGQNDPVALRATEWLLIMGAWARSSPESAPLLGTRVHMFFRGLNEANICLEPGCPTRSAHPATAWSSFSLKPLQKCNHCGSRVFPLEVCWHCGLAIIPVYISDGRWSRFAPVNTINTDRFHLSWWDNPSVDELYDSEAQEDSDPYHKYLCTCGKFYSEPVKICDCGKAPIRLGVFPSVDNRLEKCPRCGGEAGAFDEVTRSFITGDDASTAVLVENIVRSLPPDSESSEKPCEGRRLLCFSDSRQSAAFFAPYLKRTTCTSAYQRPLLDAIQRAVSVSGTATVEEVANAFVNLSRTQPYVVMWSNIGKENETYEIKPSKFMSRSDLVAIKRNCTIALYRQLLSSFRQKNKITGLALASTQFELLDHERDKLREMVPELCPAGDDIFSAVQTLLQLFSTRKALTFPDSIQAYEIDPYVVDAAFHRSESSRTSAGNTFRWNPYYAPARSKRLACERSRQLAMVCKWTGMSFENDAENLRDLMDRLLDALYEKENPDHGVLIDCGHGRRKLNGDRLLIEIPNRWFRCDLCGQLIPPVLNHIGMCPSPECRGRNKQLSDDDLKLKFMNNHERARYRAEPFALEVKEHTAQLQLRSSKKYQDDFKAGRVNVLSCSTTFEMGVDVGTLKAVMLRNMPPSPSNYIQRAGRVGRRQDGFSFVATYCAKNPHDQYFFNNPEKMISGKVNTPIISLENDVLAQRHVHSYLLGRFLRDHWDDRQKSSTSLGEFFLTSEMSPDQDRPLAQLFPRWMSDNRDSIIIACQKIIPKESRLSPDAAYSRACKSLMDDAEESVFSKYVERTINEYDNQALDLEREAAREGCTPREKAVIYKCIENIQKYKDRFYKRRLIDLLSSVGWLPGYAFPQDTIELRVLQRQYGKKMNLTRDRAVGISEYAPGAEIIADGMVFKSRGVVGYRKKSDEPLFERKKYRSCDKCRKIEQFPQHQEPGNRKCDCGGKFSTPRTYIIPEGFSTAVMDPVESPRFRRLRPPPTSQVFLVEGARKEEFSRHPLLAQVNFALKKEATLFRANRGHKSKKFTICMRCGTHIDADSRGKTHTTLWGNFCGANRSEIMGVDLAHEFKTDVLELRFKKSPSLTKLDFWRSFLSAFINGSCRCLNIDSKDVSGLIHGLPDESVTGELVIYDRIPGGAGHLKRITENLEACLKNAYQVVANCPDPSCVDEESSCYACLRSYENRFDWEFLKKKPVKEWLTEQFRDLK